MTKLNEPSTEKIEELSNEELDSVNGGTIGELLGQLLSQGTAAGFGAAIGGGAAAGAASGYRPNWLL